MDPYNTQDDDQASKRHVADYDVFPPSALAAPSPQSQGDTRAGELHYRGVRPERESRAQIPDHAEGFGLLSRGSRTVDAAQNHGNPSEEPYVTDQGPVSGGFASPDWNEVSVPFSDQSYGLPGSSDVLNQTMYFQEAVSGEMVWDESIVAHTTPFVWQGSTMAPNALGSSDHQWPEEVAVFQELSGSSPIPLGDGNPGGPLWTNTGMQPPSVNTPLGSRAAFRPSGGERGSDRGVEEQSSQTSTGTRSVQAGSNAPGTRVQKPTPRTARRRRWKGTLISETFALNPRTGQFAPVPEPWVNENTQFERPKSPFTTAPIRAPVLTASSETELGSLRQEGEHVLEGSQPGVLADMALIHPVRPSFSAFYEDQNDPDAEHDGSQAPERDEYSLGG